MTRQEEIIQLRKFPHHYLWNKNRAAWTEEDLANLENPTLNTFRNRPEVVVKTNNFKREGQPVALVIKGNRTEFRSVAAAARATQIKPAKIYAALNGYSAFAGAQWEKIIINQ
jgi:hypothetical protein